MNTATNPTKKARFIVRLPKKLNDEELLESLQKVNKYLKNIYSDDVHSINVKRGKNAFGLIITHRKSHALVTKHRRVSLNHNTQSNSLKLFVYTTIPLQ